MVLVEREYYGDKRAGWAKFREVHHLGPLTCVHCDKEGIIGKKIRYGHAFRLFGRTLYKDQDGTVEVCATCEWDPMEGVLRTEIDEYRDWRAGRSADSSDTGGNTE